MLLSLESPKRRSVCLLNYTSATSTTFPTNSVHQLCMWSVNCVILIKIHAEKFVPGSSPLQRRRPHVRLIKTLMWSCSLDFIPHWLLKKGLWLELNLLLPKNSHLSPWERYFLTTSCTSKKKKKKKTRAFPSTGHGFFPTWFTFF